MIGKNIALLRPQEINNDIGNNILSKTLNGNWQGELINQKKDGTIFPISLSTSVIKDEKGDSIALIGVAWDITERKKHEIDLKSAMEKVEASDQLKGEFLSQMSHEIRTPLNVIMANASLLKDELHDIIDAELVSCFDSIEMASKRIIRTVDLILNMSEVQTGSFILLQKYFDLNHIVLQPLVQSFKNEALEKKLELTYTCDLTTSSIYADEYCITQICSNLIDNAIKYTKKGSINVNLFKNENSQLVIEIKDTGIGISEEFLKIMFRPFTQEEQGYQRSFDGNGLGLALVNKYCTLNNIKIEVESKKNIGSKFWLIFNH